MSPQTEWEDPAVFERNREVMRGPLGASADAAAAPACDDPAVLARVPIGS